ncbi:hypothetical protein NC652_036618 [Populus alba x Populus x berolinensis]|nr:hypothetical protein NC652_036618 [Populus alba x Populus x berolinensis]
MDQLEAGLEPKLCKNFPGPALKLLDMKYADVGLGEKRIRQDTREEEKGEQPEELVGQRHFRLVEPWWVSLCWTYEDREMTPLHVFGQRIRDLWIFIFPT